MVDEEDLVENVVACGMDAILTTFTGNNTGLCVAKTMQNLSKVIAGTIRKVNNERIDDCSNIDMDRYHTDPQYRMNVEIKCGPQRVGDDFRQRAKLGIQRFGFFRQLDDMPHYEYKLKETWRDFDFTDFESDILSYPFDDTKDPCRVRIDRNYSWLEEA